MIAKLFEDNKKLIIFSTGFSFTIIIGLIIFDLLPECFELMINKWQIVLYAVIGIILLKALDVFVPDHDHESKEKNHMEHIGLISAMALVLHNLIEGTAIYTSALSNSKMGLIMSLAVCFHNIPLGIQVTSLLKTQKEKIIMTIGLVLSSISGIFLINVLNITLNSNTLGVLISLTLGMLIYISLFEMLCEIKEHKKNYVMLYGIIIGLIIVIISMIL